MTFKLKTLSQFRFHMYNLNVLFLKTDKHVVFNMERNGYKFVSV